MKSIYLVLLITLPLILCQDYKVPDLDYDQTDPTCDNVNNLIVATSADIARLTSYVTDTLPARLSKLKDVYSSVKKTCQIISLKRPSLIQTSTKLRTDSIKTLENLRDQVKHVANSLTEAQSNKKIMRSLISLETLKVDPNDLCDDTYNAINNLIAYLKFLVSSVKSEYIDGKLANRLSSLTSFNNKCISSACDDSDTDTNQGSDDPNYWTFFPTLDSGGGDITNLGGYSVAQLKQWCKSNPDCLGFNNNGWVKSQLQPRSQWYQWTSDTSLGFYAKSAQAGVNDDNDDAYDFFPTLDSGGGDITNLGGYSVQQLKDYCNSNPDCKGFNSNGWVKNTIQPRSQWYQWTSNVGLGFYLKTGKAPVPTPATDEYVFYPTLDSGGGDITNLGGYSVDQLKSWCSSNPDCKGFNTNGWVKSQINPKSQWYQWTTDQSLGFYLKKSVADSLDSASTDNPDDWTFFPTLDSGGGDITNLGGYSVAQLKQYCKSNPDCLGFNNNGWVKSQLQPRSQWYQWTSDTSLGFYVKSDQAGINDDNDDAYDFFPTLDSGGGDITNLGGYSVQQLKDYCNSNPDCKGFNSNGWVKNTIQPRSQWYQWTSNVGLGFYLKTGKAPATAPTTDDYTFYPGLDSGGNDITNLGGYSVAQLKSYCSSNSQCVGFNTNGWVKYALNPTSQWYQWTTDPNQGFYVKGSAAPSTPTPKTGDYTFYPGLDSGGNDITNLGGYSVQQLKDYCDSNSQCKGFNTNGWVKYALNPTSQWYQWTTDPNQGFYVKNS